MEMNGYLGSLLSKGYLHLNHRRPRFIYLLSPPKDSTYTVPVQMPRTHYRQQVPLGIRASLLRTVAGKRLEVLACYAHYLLALLTPSMYPKAPPWPVINTTPLSKESVSHSLNNLVFSHRPKMIIQFRGASESAPQKF